MEGFRPEWCISTTYHAWDTPFWLGTLDLLLQLCKILPPVKQIPSATHFHVISNPLSSLPVHKGGCWSSWWWWQTLILTAATSECEAQLPTQDVHFCKLPPRHEPGLLASHCFPHPAVTQPHWTYCNVTESSCHTTTLNILYRHWIQLSHNHIEHTVSSLNPAVTQLHWTYCIITESSCHTTTLNILYRHWIQLSHNYSEHTVSSLNPAVTQPHWTYYHWIQLSHNHIEHTVSLLQDSKVCVKERHSLLHHYRTAAVLVTDPQWVKVSPSLQNCCSPCNRPTVSQGITITTGQLQS